MNQVKKDVFSVFCTELPISISTPGEDPVKSGWMATGTRVGLWNAGKETTWADFGGRINRHINQLGCGVSGGKG